MAGRKKNPPSLIQYNNDDSYTNNNAVTKCSDCVHMPLKKDHYKRTDPERRAFYYEDTNTETQKEFSLFMQSLLVRLLSARKGICFCSGR